MSYITKQKSKILEEIIKQKKEFTVKDVYISLNEEVGLTTIYRLIDKLVKEGKVERFIGEKNIPYYAYLENCEENNHFYLKCTKCKNMKHIDCDCINDLSKHIVKEHKFNLKKENIIINGLCEKCSKKGERNE